MKKRNVMAVVLFSIITFGIYDLFWLASVKKELNAKTNVHTPTLWLLFAPVLILIVAFIAMFASAFSRQSMATGNTASAGASIVAMVIYLIAIVAIIPITFYWFFKFSKAVNHYTNGELNTAVTMLLLWVLRFIGLAVIQDKFNDMIDGGATPVAVAAAPVPPAPAQPIAPKSDVSTPIATTVLPNNQQEAQPQPTPVESAPTQSEAPVAPQSPTDTNSVPPTPPSNAVQ